MKVVVPSMLQNTPFMIGNLGMVYLHVFVILDLHYGTCVDNKKDSIYIYIFIYLHLFIYIISPAQQANWPVYPVIDWLVRQQRRLAEQEDTEFIFFHSGHKKKPDQTSSPPNLKSSCFFFEPPVQYQIYCVYFRPSAGIFHMTWGMFLPLQADRRKQEHIPQGPSKIQIN